MIGQNYLQWIFSANYVTCPIASTEVRHMIEQLLPHFKNQPSWLSKNRPVVMEEYLFSPNVLCISSRLPHTPHMIAISQNLKVGCIQIRNTLLLSPQIRHNFNIY